MQQDPKKRLSADEVLQHQWLQRKAVQKRSALCGRWSCWGCERQYNGGHQKRVDKQWKMMDNGCFMLLSMYCKTFATHETLSGVIEVSKIRRCLRSDSYSTPSLKSLVVFRGALHVAGLRKLTFPTLGFGTQQGVALAPGCGTTSLVELIWWCKGSASC